MSSITADVSTLRDLRSFAKKLQTNLPKGAVVALVGPLGAGKTTLVQEVARLIGILSPVQSPTYTLLKTYRDEEGAVRLNHVDAYRANDEDAHHVLEECFSCPEALCMVEWADRIANAIPDSAVWVRIEPTKKDQRIATIFSGRPS